MAKSGDAAVALGATFYLENSIWWSGANCFSALSIDWPNLGKVSTWVCFAGSWLPSKAHALSRYAVSLPQCANMSLWSWSQRLRKPARQKRSSIQAMASWTGRPLVSSTPNRKWMGDPLAWPALFLGASVACSSLLPSSQAKPPKGGSSET